jgi:Tol biopolymer transport system component
MKCQNSSCQAELPEGARFCIVCGATAPVAGNAYESPPQQDQRSTSGLLLAAAVLLGLAIIVVAAYFLYQFLFSGPDTLVYALQDEGAFGYANSIGVMAKDGKDNVEIARDRDGFVLVGEAAHGHSYLAPNGRWLALFERNDSNWDLALTSIEGGAPIYTDKVFPTSATLAAQGFSPDGRLYAYTTYDNDDREYGLHVVNDQGVEILFVPNAAFGDFFPDGDSLLIVETDNDGLFSTLSSVDLNDGIVNRITDLSEDSVWVRPIVSPDGKQVYFYSDQELLKTSTDGGAAQQVYEFESRYSSTFLSPDEEYLVVYDRSASDNLGDLRLMAMEEEQQVRIDRDVNLAGGGTHLGERPVAFSNNGKLVAYLTDDADNLSLYVTGVAGQERRRISDDNSWMTFAFSPNSKQIAYIEGSRSDQPGDLYVANVDGTERQRLDVDVWSFRYTPDGRYIVYSKVEDLIRRNPESTILRIRPNGEGQELLHASQNGLITMLDWVD